MTRLFEQLSDTEKEKYLKDVSRSINLNEYAKIKNFFLDNELFTSNTKLNPLKSQIKDLELILDNSSNRWFILCVDGKIQLLSKKNVTIHTKDFKYEKRNVAFNKKYNIKKLEYLVEYIDNIGANLSLNITNYNGKIGKEKWLDESEEITNMTLHTQNDSSIAGYTYNGQDFSLCVVGKGYEKQKDILK